MAYVEHPAGSFNCDERSAGIRWAETVVDGPVLDLLEQVLRSDFCDVRALPISSTPPLPTNLLRAAQLTDEQRRRLDRATHVIVVNIPCLPTFPPVHMLGALGLATAIADAFGGVVLDPSLPRALDLGDHRDFFLVTGMPVLSKFLSFPQSSDSPTTQRVTSVGLGRFGVPDLYLAGVPNALPASPLLLAAAVRILELAWDAVDIGTSDGDFEIRADLACGQVDLLRSMGRGEEDDHRPVQLHPRIHGGSSVWGAIKRSAGAFWPPTPMIGLGPLGDEGAWVESALGHLSASS